jgi:hypothetical protein
MRNYFGGRSVFDANADEEVGFEWKGEVMTVSWPQRFLSTGAIAVVPLGVSSKEAP